MSIAIAPGLSIGEDELDFDFVRSSGPGGQNVNKVETAAQLRFDAAHSPSLNDHVRARLKTLAGRRMTKDGVVVISAQRFRTQEMNRKDAIDRLVELLRAAAHRPKTRRPTRPTLSSKTRRLESKAKHGALKKDRRATSEE